MENVNAIVGQIIIGIITVVAILALLTNVFNRCEHEWVELSIEDKPEKDCKIITQKCERCGKIRIVKINY